MLPLQGVLVSSLVGDLRSPHAHVALPKKLYFKTRKIETKLYLLVLASSLPSFMHLVSALWVNQTYPVAQIPTQP